MAHEKSDVGTLAGATLYLAGSIAVTVTVRGPGQGRRHLGGSL